MRRFALVLLVVLLSGFFTNVEAVSVKLSVKSGETGAERNARAIKAAIATGEKNFSDVLVVMVDANGMPLEKARQKPAPASNELTFTYNSPDYPWSPEELATVQGWVEKIYPKLKELCGPPAFNSTVNISHDPTLFYRGVAGIYYVNLDEIALHDVNRPDVIAHEMKHAFDDEKVVRICAYLEGMTRDVEVVIMSELGLTDYFNYYHKDGYDERYTEINASGVTSRDTNFYYGFPSLSLKYAQASYAWWKVAYENPGFRKNFNQALYKQAAADPSILYDAVKLKTLAASVARKVEGKFFSDWYDQQFIFKTYLPVGLETLFMGNGFDYTIFVFNREADARETMLSNAFVSWTAYACDGTSIASGEGLTNEFGVYVIPTDLYFLLEQNGGYKGKLNFQLDIQTSKGNIQKWQATTAPGTYQGLYGITSACSGQVGVVGPGASVTLEVVNGLYEAASLKDVAGTFTVTDKTNRTKAIYTKDKANYYGPVLK